MRKRKKFGKAIEELNYLNSEGLKINEGTKTLYLQCVLVVVDNLGINQSCGFEGGFNAKYYCRRCTVPSILCKCTPFEVEGTLRHRENYEKDLKAKTHGVKQKCVFNSISNFHITENVSFDVMHDFCEGVCVFTLEGILTELILIRKVLDLDEVNNRIDLFDYGTAESNNKPRPLYEETCHEGEINNPGLKRKIRCNQSAAEMLCLTRYLGLIIGDLIPDKNDPFWCLYRILREIISIVMAPYFTDADLCRLDELIVKHNEEYMRLLRELFPKHHFTTHLVKIMRLNGPLRHLWGMTPERKNKELKGWATSISSKKNLPHSIGVRNQLYLSYSTSKFTNPKDYVELGTVIGHNVDAEIKNLNEKICGELHSKKYSFLKILGKKYEVGTVIISSTKDLEPSFGKIINIYTIKGLIYLHVKCLKNVEFDPYYFAHRVIEDSLYHSKKNLIWINNLPEPDPCVFVKNNDGTFVSMRYH